MRGFAHQQQLSGGLAIAMMPPMTRNASTSTSSMAITTFVFVSMGERMMHKVEGRQPDPAP